jgi:hypothetical protein
MDHDSSSTKVFDFSTQANITAVLAGIRNSELSQVQKNELRDLVFLYTSGGGDDSIRISLEQKLSVNNIFPSFTKVGSSVKKPAVESKSVPSLPFGTLRPVPVFETPTIKIQSSNSNEKEIKPEIVRPFVKVDVEKIKSERLNSDKVSGFSPSIQTQVALTPEPLPVSDVSKTPVIDKPTMLTSVDAQHTEKVVTAPVSGFESQTAKTIPEAQSINKKYLDRIREIKSDVNSKVGNPVNLVDIDNQVGREYMNALLEAMKKLNSGGIDDLEMAMNRLETAYVAVDKVVADRSIKIPTVEKKTEKVVVKNEINEPKLSVNNESKPVANNELKIPAMRVMASDVPVSSPYTKNVKLNPVSNTNLAPIPTKITSLAEERKMPSFADLPTTIPNKEHEGNPLFTAEIDAGLDQLLSDWSLFKKSGLFGSGPKGREHPLFKKIAGLQIPMLLAGRFDDASQEIKQSITDYMNGWRYEQGIVYEPGETFENYLRRVIRHIIDLQKNRN